MWTFKRLFCEYQKQKSTKRRHPTRYQVFLRPSNRTSWVREHIMWDDFICGISFSIPHNLQLHVGEYCAATLPRTATSWSLLVAGSPEFVLWWPFPDKFNRKLASMHWLCETVVVIQLLPGKLTIWWQPSSNFSRKPATQRSAFSTHSSWSSPNCRKRWFCALDYCSKVILMTTTMINISWNWIYSLILSFNECCPRDGLSHLQ